MTNTDKIKREYIEAAYRLLCEEEFEKVTIRQIAKDTGRNSASLYYYFDDLKDLIATASIRFLMDYYDTVFTVVNSHFNTLEINLQSWECLAWYAFRNVPVYEIFFLDDVSRSEKALAEYLSVFPEEKNQISNYFLGEPFDSLDLRMRDKWMFKKAADEGLIAPESIDYLGEMDFYLFCGMMNELKGSSKDPDYISAMVQKFVTLLSQTYQRHLLPGKSILGCHLETIHSLF